MQLRRNEFVYYLNELLTIQWRILLTTDRKMWYNVGMMEEKMKRYITTSKAKYLIRGPWNVNELRVQYNSFTLKYGRIDFDKWLCQYGKVYFEIKERS